ncbi:MAG TPA: hypothetical protein VJP84_09180 [Steroidobacteraceae bacterium]|jgi:hypothetical protein|nr:hypothetical protein [Steroidobacteraceae bacterium]
MIVLLAIALPLWLLAGFGDWLCHRRTLIQRTAGPRESALHLVLYLVIAIPIVLALFLEVSTSLLLLMTLSVLAHSAVSLWDTSYAQPRRHIAPIEQMIHSHLEMLPVFALALVIVMHWDVVVQPRWTLALRAQPLPDAWRNIVLVLLVPGLLMILEELARGLREQRRA